MKTILFVILFSVFSFAFTPIASFSSAPAFSSQELFAKLDALGENGNWMQLDTLSIVDPSIEAILKSHKGFLSAWALEFPEKSSRVAVLISTGKSEKLTFYEIKKFDGKITPLSVHPKLYPELILSDFRGVATNEFVHKDDPSLKLKISDKSIQFTYRRQDKTPLRFENNFSKLLPEEKARVVSEYRDFFLYEYALMLRAFVQSTRGIFNWQSWHWYLPEWNQKYLISKEEITAILSSGYPPSTFRIFFAKTSRNVLVEMRTDGNGFYEMNVRIP